MFYFYDTKNKKYVETIDLFDNKIMYCLDFDRCLKFNNSQSKNVFKKIKKINKNIRRMKL